MAETDLLRELPAVHELLAGLPARFADLPHALIVAEIRRLLAQKRAAIRAGGDAGEASLADRIVEVLDALHTPSLRRVINATGVVLHTNLGRAPLGVLPALPGYSNLEYDVAAGGRGRRDTHISGLLERLIGAAGIGVNNNAAAIWLALHELAAGGEVIVSRGELIEVGDGFRIPDIMQRSGAVLREVGATNSTRVEDYRDAINERTRLLMRVHPSNFHMRGFTARPALPDLVELGRERAIPVYEDLGSGCVVDLQPFGIAEPLVGASIAAGVDLVSFSGDKLIGGPQAGILAGRADLVARLRRNPMFRAFRLDKLIVQALETTLRNLLLERWDSIPAIAMIRQPAEEIRRRAQDLLARTPRIAARLIAGESVIGGGSTPDQAIPTWLIALHLPHVSAAESRLRAHDPPVIARIEAGRLLIDLRTVFPVEEAELAQAVSTLF